MKRILLSLIAMATLFSCAEKTPKTLILYYSQTGATETVANELQKQTGADIFAYDVEKAYDGTYDETIQRCIAEREAGIVPALKPLECDLSEYDVVFLAYPIWFGTYAPPVKALLAEADFEGKTIVPVCTFGSGGIEASSAELAAALPNSTIAEGFGIRHDRIRYAEEELNRFLIENGWKEGRIDPLPEYSAQAEMTPEELDLYREATDGYPFPLGEPVSVGSRTVSGGVDYLFNVVTTAPDGGSAEGKVYVCCREGRAPEFTRVAR